MNNFSRKIFCSFLLSFVSVIFNTNLHSHTNKTYLRPLDSSYYFVPQNQFYDFVAKQERGKNISTQISFSPFYFRSSDGEKIGRYFGTNEKDKVLISARDSQMDVFYSHLIHIAAVGNRKANVSFYPKTTYSGFTFSFFYNFKKFLKNFYFKFNLPFLKMKNDIRMGFYSQGYLAGEDTNVVEKYLKGEYQNSVNPTRLQETLKKAKIGNEAYKNGVSDLDFLLAYRFWSQQEQKSAILSLGLIAPVGNKPNGEYLFEPLLGNGKHWGFKIGGETYFRLLGNDKFNLNIFIDLVYQYLFRNTQKRTLSVVGAKWGQYYLLGRNGAVNEPLIPAANILTRDVKVSPGSQFDCDIKFRSKLSNFEVDLGTYLLFQEQEELKLKEDFPQDTYAVATPAFNTNNNFGANPNADIRFTFDDYWLNNKSIDLKAAQNPSVISCKIYMQLGYNYELKQHNNKSFNLSIGGSYNFVSENSQFEGWAVWLKNEIAF